MTPEEFRAAGHELIDWITDYRSSVESHRVFPAVTPGQIREALPPVPPVGKDPIEALLRDLDGIVAPGVLSTQHPMHFGWFPSNASLSSVLGDIASSGLAGLGISWESCPALTEVEEVVCDWMRQLVGLSDAWRGSIQDTASTATLVALLIARERASNLALFGGGTQSVVSPMVVYATGQAHSSVHKAALLAGFGADNVRIVAADPQTYAMDVVALREQLANDVASGRTPAAIVASVGSTGVTAIDPVGAIVEVAREYNCWVHVDAAMAGSAMLLPECRWMWDGIEGADSVVWNPHKWMGTILDCSLMYVRDVEFMEHVLSTNPSYLQSTADGKVPQYRDWGIPLGRRFRALKLWFHLRLDGVEAIQARLRRDLANAQRFRSLVEGTPGWEVVAPVPIQTVCVRHTPAGIDGDALDEHTKAWIEKLKRDGRTFLSGSVLDGRWMARVSIGAASTEWHHLERLWELMREAVDTEGAVSSG